jgi:hypothetical protein
MLIIKRRRFKRGSRVGIPESQLKTWANQGAAGMAKSTYASIRNALQEELNLPPTSYDVYLQGSYRNDTNIYADMDVDVVVELTDGFYYDVGRLPPANQAAFHGAYRNATYCGQTFGETYSSHFRLTTGHPRSSNTTTP